MAEKFLHREDAPFGSSVWHKIDEAVTEAAKGQLSGRRMLHIEGPYGSGVKLLPGGDSEVGVEAAAEGVSVAASLPLPMAFIYSSFTLPVRDIASFEQTGLPLDLSAVARAAIACARQEDALIFNGSDALGVKGLLNAEGTQSFELHGWDDCGTAAQDIIAAATVLDEAGFHGPYTLALAPALYNLLFRRYPQGNQTEIEHLRVLVTDGIVKAPAISSGGVLLASGRQFATIAVGRDLVTGFVGPAGAEYEFLVSESAALRLLQPGAVCVLK